VRFSASCAAVDKILTDTAHDTVPLRQLSFLFSNTVYIHQRILDHAAMLQCLPVPFVSAYIAKHISHEANRAVKYVAWIMSPEFARMFFSRGRCISGTNGQFPAVLSLLCRMCRVITSVFSIPLGRIYHYSPDVNKTRGSVIASPAHTAKMRPISRDVARDLYVCLSVSGTRMSCTKAAEPIEMPFEGRLV